MNTERIKILYIDDEPHNLNSFKAVFRMDYNVFLAGNTQQAMEQLASHPDIRVVLSDQRMPDKTGVQFFEELRATHPEPIRILITGYTDIESVISAINRGNIFRYIKKPWTDEDIKSAIDEGNKFFVANSMLMIKNKELQQAYDELDKFAYSVTHDMRGPLLSTLGLIEVMQSTDNIAEIKDMLGMMEKAVQKLDSFIRSIHEYYNLKRGELEITEVDFNEIVKDLIDIYDITGKMNGVRFVCKVEQVNPFRCDTTSLKIILNNLLSNAFKYQRKDEADRYVELKIETTKDKAIITVSDNGIGIHESHIGEIFKMFYRATAEEVGSGFGLYNVKDAINKLNGNIEVNSKPGVGSVFKVTIPSK